MKTGTILKNVFIKSIKIFRHIPKTGKPSSIPGTIDYFGNKGERPVQIDYFAYNQKDCNEYYDVSPGALTQQTEKNKNYWVNISGVHDSAVIEEFGRLFDIHPLTLEDIANTTIRPKYEEHDDYLFLVLKMIYFDEDQKEIIIEQTSIILKDNIVLVFQENGLDVFDPLRERIRSSKGKVRKMGTDYLLYCIIDAIVDHYFIILEKLSEEVEQLENKLLEDTDSAILHKVYRLKQELLFLRKSIWPTREVINKIQRNDHDFITEPTIIFFRDIYDHTIQVIETIETFRDMVTGMHELYISNTSNKTNEIMKVLTLFAAIFIPLTFIAGVYGMNFAYIPELKWKHGYFIWWGTTLCIAIGMVIVFKRKKWL